MEKHHCVIIGSGPAGYTAAIYAARAGMKPLLYTGTEPGGQLTLTSEVENFPGYPDGVMGPEMMEEFRKQAERFGTILRYERIEKVDFTGPVHHLVSEAGLDIEADTVLICTGASAKWLGLPSEKTYMNKGVSACAVCDGFFFRGKAVGVVGGGDTATEEALYLSKLCSKVDLIVRRDELRASKIMQERVLNTPNIKVWWNSETKEIKGDQSVQSVVIQNNISQEMTELPLSGFFVAIGHQPNTAIFKGWLDMDESGYLITQPGSSKTNREGVFAGGDAADRIYRQAVTAAGTGCMAALDAERYLGAHGIL
ncbi:MAG: thioredoxin-disulfide reductase [Saprospiraceae bacterium]|jgi:thioredoxin reductase (NADPH)|nr:thioredoxin-disulfide reductase [Saprospiraceae bacterium]MBK6477664.1 thioredoxin-disulfide reductase [Saprospiraceae bacterium]MBK7370988.1 thioredoxin-disulfide reductase [Saprospiraceae bacterium]MBK7436511.1 thioredoxin-disulfide reductase [Saprospiraceae bacterium]MBK8281059.1 thioredoxin-disulfide reductase [Saprospiraceae bacterium]